MRIAISGTANTGKSTLIQHFQARWPMYATPLKTYRDIIAKNDLPHSKHTTEELQLLILDWMMQELQSYPKDANVIFDRCPWDNLAYTLYGNTHGNISDEVTAATISFVKESMKHLDIIFWLPYNPNIKIVDDNLRETDVAYIREIDDIFASLYDQYLNKFEADVFYPKEDSPAIICIENEFASVDDKLMFIGEFLDPAGNLIVDESSVLDPENLKLMEQMLKDQQREMENEQKINNIIKELKK